MPTGYINVLWDNEDITDSYVSKTADIKNFAHASILIKNVSAKYGLKYKIEATMRVGDSNIHASGWKELKAATVLAKSTEIIFIKETVAGFTQLQELDLAAFVWHHLRVSLVNQTPDTRIAKATVIVNQRRAG